MTDSIATTDRERLATAAPFVFLMVAAADGSIDKKEVKEFMKTLLKPEFAIVTKAMEDGGQQFEQLLVSARELLADPAGSLVALREAIEGQLPAPAAHQFKQALYGLGESVAKASGGVLGLFGSKVDKDEQAVLDVIAVALGLGSDVPEATPAIAAALEGEVLTDVLFPTLKPAEWAVSARGRVAMQCIFSSDEIQDNEPVVGFVHDFPEAVAFVNADRLGEKLSMEQMHAHALANLERRLEGAAQWHEINEDLGVEGLAPVTGLVLSGDYFAAEAILSQKFLLQAHERLGAAMLMAIVPQRGELFIGEIVSKTDPEPERLMFAQFAIKRHFNPEQAPIAPNVFIVNDGKVVGQIAGIGKLIASAREAAGTEQRQQEDLLAHTGQLKGEAGSAELAIEVRALCLSTAYQNVQHLIRAYVDQVKGDEKFGGTVAVSVVVEDPDYREDMRAEVAANFANMAKYLTDQFVTLGTTTASGGPVEVQCELGTVETA